METKTGKAGRPTELRLELSETQIATLEYIVLDNESALMRRDAEIILMRSSGKSYKKISAALSVHVFQICKVIKRFIETGSLESKKGRPKLIDAEQMREIATSIASGGNVKTLALAYGVSGATIYALLKKHSIKTK